MYEIIALLYIITFVLVMLTFFRHNCDRNAFKDYNAEKDNGKGEELYIPFHDIL